MTETVGVVVPTRDRRPILAATLRSILGQRDVEVRVVVVDDGSTDGTPEWVRTLDARVEVITHEQPTGAAASRNDGVALVEASWVAFCDDDDLWAPTKLARQLEQLRNSGARWCCAGAVCVDAQLRVTESQRLAAGGDLAADLLVENVVPGGGSGVLADTALVREVGAFATDLPSSEDWDLWIRLAATGPVAVADEPLVAYRVWSGGKSRRIERMEAAYDAIQHRHRELAARLGVDGDRRRHQRFLAKQALRNGDRVGAARRYQRSGSSARAAAALVAPALLDRVGSRRQREVVPETWARAADEWLAPHREELAGVR